MLRILFLLSLPILLSACATNKLYQVDLIPAPDAFAEGLVNPFPEEDPFAKAPYRGILYATDRLPLDIPFSEQEEDEVFYSNKRGLLLRLGMGRVELDKQAFVKKKAMNWDEVRRISLQKNRPQSYPLQVKKVMEMGVLKQSYTKFHADEVPTKGADKPGKDYAKLINEKLAQSKRKEITIYIHGYNTNFQESLLVSGELWHYMGYDGVFIAYSWPATPRGLAYLADTDTAMLASRNLRLFLEYLAETTDAEQINIIGYSMGTRVTTYALQDAALIHFNESSQHIHKKLPIGDVILIGSDLDRGVFAGFLLDGFMKVPKTFTIYMSGTDSALSTSRWLFERYRLGEAWHTTTPPVPFVDYLKRTPQLRFVDVTQAKNADTGNGHHYFMESPWVSSDLLMSLLYDLTPTERGLVQDPSQMWRFPEDYPQRLKTQLQQLPKNRLQAR